ncbi:MAG: MOSC domain-containing protein [Paracoccaceae bacterium]
MPALLPTDFTARITWLGRVADRDAALKSETLQAAQIVFGGIEGEAHGGVTRLSCSRVLSQYPRNTVIANVRQFSVVSAQDLAMIADAMGVERLDPAWLGASICLDGLPDLTSLPPSSRLQAPSGATLVVDMENRPCMLPAKEIEAIYPGKGKAFKAAAQRRRGVTAWVEAEGALRLGDEMRLHIPDQPVWPHLEAARAGASK